MIRIRLQHLNCSFILERLLIAAHDLLKTFTRLSRNPTYKTQVSLKKDTATQLNNTIE